MSLVEVVIGLIVLTFGLLALAATLGYTTRLVQSADLRTERAAALRHTVEWLRAQPFDSVQTRDSAEADTVNAFRVWWGVDSVDWGLKQVHVVADGPIDRTAPPWLTMTRDTLISSIARPYP